MGGEAYPLGMYWFPNAIKFPIKLLPITYLPDLNATVKLHVFE